MPKELIHFKVAMKTADRLAGTRYGPALAQYTPLLLLGSIFHDTLFYGVTPSTRPLVKLADWLHGANGQDTYTLLRLQASHVPHAADLGQAAALLVGMASHLSADVTMHPMIWHYSGRYYARDTQERSLARQRHRALESLLDMTLCPEMLGRPMYRIRQLLRGTGNALLENLPLEQLGDLTGILPATMQPALPTALATHARLQATFTSTSLARLLHILMPALPPSIREVASLYYAPQLLAHGHRISGNIDYLHPVTGKPISATGSEMLNQAADNAAALCIKLEAAAFKGDSINLQETGPSLDTGLPGTPCTAMRLFAKPPFPPLPSGSQPLP